jgi:hypothetical protein
MPDDHDHCSPSCSHAAEERAERLLLQAYTRLPLLPQKDDGSRTAILCRSGILQVRLTEVPPKHVRELPLWIELYDTTARSYVESFGCAEIEDAVSTVARMVAAAERSSERSTDDRG